MKSEEEGADLHVVVLIREHRPRQLVLFVLNCSGFPVCYCLHVMIRCCSDEEPVLRFMWHVACYDVIAGVQQKYTKPLVHVKKLQEWYLQEWCLQALSNKRGTRLAAASCLNCARMLLSHCRCVNLVAVQWCAVYLLKLETHNRLHGNI